MHHRNATDGLTVFCKRPLWRSDDFSLCFRTSYLQVIFPLSLVAISLLVLFLGTLVHCVQLCRSSRRSYKPLHHEHIASRRRPSHTADPIESSSETSSSDATTEDDDDGFMEHLSLRRTMSKSSAAEVKIDRPRHGVIRVALEEITVAAQVGLHVAAYMIHNEGDWVHGRTHILGGVITWAYILLLATIRLFYSTAYKHPVLAYLWGHTTTLYLFDFFFTAVRFRSVLIHDYPYVERSIVISEFALVLFLLIIAFTGRRGNQAVRQEYVDGLEPSREPLASLLSLATFSWVDPVVWHGYWHVFEMKDVWNLREDDHAVNLLSTYRQMKKTFSLSLTLAKYFQDFLWLQGAWTLVYAVFMYAPTLILREVLEYVQDTDRYPANVAWLLVSLILVTGFITSIGNNQALFIGRRICIRLRAVIIGEVYAKALRRKAAASAELTLGRKEKDKKAPEDEESKGEEDEQDEGQVNVGAIINLMSVDSFKVAEICAYLHYLLAGVPIQIIIAAGLLYTVMGWSSIAGILAMLCLLPINYYISRKFSQIQDKIMAATDKRIHATNEVLQNVRIIKYFAWEQRYEGVVGESRSLELRQLRNRYILWAFAAAVWYASPIIITFISFLVYTIVEGKELRAPVAFTALSLFQLLRIPLDQLADMITNVLQAKVSVDRVAEFLAEEETEKYQQLKHDEVDPDAPLIGFKKGNFSWGSRKSLNKRDGPQAFQLIDLDIEFVPEKLNIIAGPTGSGKTSLLMALLGEMTKISGEVYLPGSHSREDLFLDENGHTESVAYCAQQAWLVNDTIKANILFARAFDEERYKAVISACSLEKDLQIFEAGDETEIGEKGITLSGGQKQRISLARALYSSSKHLLLDDCLSAVDSHTAKHIYENCIKGPLMEKRTCILVTHNVALCIPRSEFVVVMSNGRISAQGTPAEIVASGALGADEYLKTAVSSRMNSQAPSRVPSSTDLNAEELAAQATEPTTNGDTDGKPKQTKTAEERLKEKEEFKSEGSVDWKVYALYLKSMGSWFFWLCVAVVFLLQQLGSIATSIWIRQWAVQYELLDDQSFVADVRSSSFVHADYSFSGSCAASGTCAWSFPVLLKPYASAPQTVGIQEEKGKVDVLYYLTVYAILGLVYAFLSLVREAIVFAGSLVASRRIHNQLLSSILRAKFRFFDTTPLGRIMNRFSRDLEAVDQEISWVALGTLHSIISVIAIIILISSITPQFLIAGSIITVIYAFIGSFYLKASRDLKRLESIQRSPLYQHFGETISGITTIRAYGDERRFVRDNLDKIDTLNRPFFFLWACNRWLSFRVDTAASFVAFFAGVFVILSVGKIDSGLAGLAMTYALSFSENILWTVRLYAMNEQNMNSVERLREYLEVEQEAAAIIPDHRPPSDWPEKGALQFEDYSTRYRPDLDQVLKKVSFTVAPLEKVGIVGRTGAGKSSLALALFRALEAEEGKIILDDINIGEIGLHDLRSNITMVPQDPTLFTGTVRSNLDPFGVYTDQEIFTALRRVHLIEEEDAEQGSDEEGASSSVPVTPTTPVNKNIFTKLSSPITESGGNLSQGQRQLLCLARALLKSPKVIVMDEATASIDYSTDSKIQATIREMEASLLTIAHRLNTIVDYDRVLVLDQGQVKEYDHAYILLNTDGSIFREMCEHSGELETLKEMARVAYEKKHPKLIDVKDSEQQQGSSS